MGSSSDVALTLLSLCFLCLTMKARTARSPGEDESVRGDERPGATTRRRMTCADFSR
jgi:hypothetical protein